MYMYLFIYFKAVLNCIQLKHKMGWKKSFSLTTRSHSEFWRGAESHEQYRYIPTESLIMLIYATNLAAPKSQGAVEIKVGWHTIWGLAVCLKKGNNIQSYNMHL